MSDIPPGKNDFAEQVQERFKSLPPVVQRAITSADVEKRMRSLAERQKLHIDQWELLENEVMLTLLNIEPMSALDTNIEKEVGVPHEQAISLVADINELIFKPIREELERSLGHPQAKDEELSDVEKLRQATLKEEGAVAPPPPQLTPAPPTQPGTPPAPKPDAKVVRGPATGAYKPGEASSARSGITDDPYRETVV